MNIDTPSQHNTATTTHTVYLALGSNLGDRHRYLRGALQYLRERVDLATISSIYETEPVGYLEQPLFLNLVCSGKTQLSPQELLKFAKEIEVTIGRQPSLRNGPRSIDIDILIYDDLHLAQADLIIPHPRMTERAFVLVPLAEIAPRLLDPISGQTMQALLEKISQRGIKKIQTKSINIP